MTASGSAAYFQHPILKHHPLLLDKITKSFNGFQGVRFFKTPGRVNMIGEHTDYNLGPVLPCALNREIIFAVKANDRDRIRVTNVEPGMEPVAIYLEQPIEPHPRGHWGNYIKAGLKGMMDYLSIDRGENKFQGFDALVSGNIPRAAGLSSSSALVVATAISFLGVNRIDLPKHLIAEICAEAEHFVGTAGGGMDQAVCLLAEKNAFVKINFHPLRAEIVPAPEGISIVIFDSMIKAEKSSFARDEYNRRVVECKLGVALFNRFLQKKGLLAQPIAFIGEIKPPFLSLDEEATDRLVGEFLKSLPERYRLTDLIKPLASSESTIRENFLKIGHQDYLKESVDGFKIKGRFRHVYTECQRVEQSQKCLMASDVARFGQLMSASQHSMAHDYEISTPEIDSLIEVILAAGAYGARLTGAGLGGSVVALVAAPKTQSLIDRVFQIYYHQRSVSKDRAPVWICQPSDGAGEIVFT